MKEYRVTIMLGIGKNFDASSIIVTANSPKEAVQKYLNAVDSLRGKFTIKRYRFTSYRAEAEELKRVGEVNGKPEYEIVGTHRYSLIYD